jgi:hypothetical protein
MKRKRKVEWWVMLKLKKGLETYMSKHKSERRALAAHAWWVKSDCTSKHRVVKVEEVKPYE